MNTKEMREILKPLVDILPRSNEDLIKLYNQKFGGEVPQSPIKLVQKNIYTYVGSGDTPPHMTKFMGIQVFVRGQPTEVTDPLILSKITTHSCFVKGEANLDLMHENDEKERKLAEHQVEEDQKTQIAVDRQNRRA